MSTALGNIEISNIAVGSSAATALALGSTTVWQRESPAPAITGPVTFTALQSNSSIRLNKVGSAPAVSLEYSTDGSNWSDYTWSGSTGTKVNLANAGDRAYFRAKNDNAKLANGASSDCCTFVATGKLSAYGDMMTLLKGDGTLQDLTDSNDCAFACLFDSCTALVDASQLALPSKYVPASGYANMFWGCSNLSVGPDLPALSANYCAYYYMFSDSGLVEAPQIAATNLLSGYECAYMFSNCTSLTTAPATLPATTLTQNCYNNMFSSCSALTSAPELPATTLAISCYYQMFLSCSSLTTAPALPATTLTTDCYIHMFKNCTSLISMDVSFTAWNPQQASTNWLTDVAASGTFTCPAELPDIRSPSRIPTGWTKVDAT